MRIRNIKIRNRIIGGTNPVFIIAEAGINHNGDFKMAKKLVYAAKRCGADCIKFQAFKATRLVSENAPKAEYQLKTTPHDESQMEMLRKLELSEKEHEKLFLLCKQTGILYLATPCNIEDVDFLEGLGVSAYKIASAYAVEPLFLEYVARKHKPILLSTGMCNMREVKSAINIIRNAGNEKLIVLQCTTDYPSALEDANLRAMQTIAKAAKVLVGYSDHTSSIIASPVAVGLGACAIERHFTLDKRLPGPDHASSFEPEEFAQAVKLIRDAEKCLGSCLKIPALAEQKNALVLRRGIIAKKNIKKGDILSINNLTFKRPVVGIPASLYKNVLGRQARLNIPANTFIHPWMIKG